MDDRLTAYYDWNLKASLCGGSRDCGLVCPLVNDYTLPKITHSFYCSVLLSVPLSPNANGRKGASSSLRHILTYASFVASLSAMMRAEPCEA